MDVLEQYLSSGKAAAPSTPKPSTPGRSVVTDQLLDSLKKVESDKDPFALNKQSKAMGAYQFMPETVQMLPKQHSQYLAIRWKTISQAKRPWQRSRQANHKPKSVLAVVAVLTLVTTHKKRSKALQDNHPKLPT